MAMRIREKNGKIVAVCAAEFCAEPGDHYIDDAEDHAIRIKLQSDWDSEKLILKSEEASKIDMPGVVDSPDFESDLCNLLNRHSKESESDTPDYILRDYLCDCLKVFDHVVGARTTWHRPDGAGAKDLPEV